MEKPKMNDNILTNETRPGRTHNSTCRLMSQQELINDLQAITLRSASNSIDAEATSKRSPELTRRVSRTEAVRQDARKLKSATLGRMGKIFKQRSHTPVTDKSSASVDGVMNMTQSAENCTEESSGKEKSNSLGKMFRRADKDGSPKKLFHPRAGSLSRILRRHPHNEDNDVADKPTEDTTPGIFSRMFSQLRGNAGRPHSGSMTAEPNIKTRNKMSSLPPKVPLNSRTTTNLSSSSPSGSRTQLKQSSQKSTNLEYSI